MTQPYEGDPTDLFDFPEVPGMEEFGLVPPTRKDVDLTGYEPTAADTAPKPPKPAAPAEEPAPVQEARANPDVPEGVTDLDEDLFAFDEIFSLDDDPYYNGTLTAEGMPANDVFIPDDASAADAGPSVTVEAQAPDEKVVGRLPQPSLDDEPRRSAVIDPSEAQWAGEEPQPTVSASAEEPADEIPAAPRPRRAAPAPAAREMDLMSGPPAPAAALDRGPRI
ncbi:MAG: hypothetical protein AAFP22_16650, partial [Planctomycetota bacterium]